MLLIEFQFKSTTRNCFEPTLLDSCPNDNPEWTQIVCGRHHTAALTKAGDLYTWGRNCCGQLGHGDMESRVIPTKVMSLDGIFIIKVICDQREMAAITDKGEVFMW